MRVSRMNGAASAASRGQGLVDAAGGRGLPLEADAAGEVGLRVEVDEQHALPGEREGRREVDGRGGFADAAFLIGDGEHAGHLVICPKTSNRTVCRRS